MKASGMKGQIIVWNIFFIATVGRGGMTMAHIFVLYISVENYGLTSLIGKLLSTIMEFHRDGYVVSFFLCGVLHKCRNMVTKGLVDVGVSFLFRIEHNSM